MYKILKMINTMTPVHTVLFYSPVHDRGHPYELIKCFLVLFDGCIIFSSVIIPQFL